MALLRIRTNHRKGRGMAIAGIVLGACWMVFAVIVGIVSALDDADRDRTGTVTAGGTVTAQDLRAGDCLAALPEGETRTLKLVPCAQPHRAEVFTSFPLSGSRFPGADEVDRLGAGGCLERLSLHVGPTRADDYEVHYMFPTAHSWSLGDRQVHCLLSARDGTMLPPGSTRAP